MRLLVYRVLWLFVIAPCSIVVPASDRDFRIGFLQILQFAIPSPCPQDASGARTPTRKESEHARHARKHAERVRRGVPVSFEQRALRNVRSAKLVEVRFTQPPSLEARQ